MQQAEGDEPNASSPLSEDYDISEIGERQIVRPESDELDTSSPATGSVGSRWASLVAEMQQAEDDEPGASSPRSEDGDISEIGERQISDELDASSPASEDNNAAERQMHGLLSPLTEPHDSSRLFVSHHTVRDGKFALRLVDQLESRGVQCWICSRDIEPGADWHRSVMKAVRECGTMVVVVSPASVESDFVQAEVSLALRLKKRVVPLLLEDELPYWDIDARLENKQRIEWWKVGEAGISVLSASV